MIFFLSLTAPHFPICHPPFFLYLTFQSFFSLSHSGSPERFISRGIAKYADEGVAVSELPLRVWTQHKLGGGYKGWLLKQLKEDARCLWSGFTEAHTERHVSFLLRMAPGQQERVASMTEAQLSEALRLHSTHTLANMHAFDAEQRLRRFESPLDIVRAFVPVRLETYELRKAHQLRARGDEYTLKAEQARFIERVADGRIDTFRAVRANIVQQLETFDFAPHLDPKGESAVHPAEDGEGVPDDAESGKGSPYQHLLRLRVDDFGAERIARLRDKCEAIKGELDTLRRTGPAQLYEQELEELRPLLEEHCPIDQAAAAQ